MRMILLDRDTVTGSIQDSEYQTAEILETVGQITFRTPMSKGAVS